MKAKSVVPVDDDGNKYSSPLSKNIHLLRWVEKMAKLTKPANIHWITGSDEENEELCAQLVEGGTFTKLNEELWPGCYYARSDASDVARVEERTFICSHSKDAAGPTNNWEDPYKMRRKLKNLFDGCMQGRTMYVLAFSMGPLDSPRSQIGVQLTDSAYAVVNMRIMARIGLTKTKSASCRVCTPSVRHLRQVTTTCRGRAIRKNISCIFLRLAKFGRMDQATVATLCLVKNVSRCASRPTLRVTKVGWQSTCSSLV
jgi:hypothetical protein